MKNSKSNYLLLTLSVTQKPMLIRKDKIILATREEATVEGKEYCFTRVYFDHEPFDENSKPFIDVAETVEEIFSNL